MFISPLASNKPSFHSFSSFYLPLLVFLTLVIIDQWVKAWVVGKIDEGMVMYQLGDGWFQILHSRNTGLAWGLGQNWPRTFKTFLTIIAPLTLILWILKYYCEKDRPSGLRYSLAFMVSGALGNLLDRLFRGDGVVDMFYWNPFGFVGFLSPPTFNLADLWGMIGMVFLAYFFLIKSLKDEGREHEK